jgi:6-phosphogluconolactonase
MLYQYITTSTIEDACGALADAISEELLLLLKEHPRALLTLPGGTTPIPLFQEIAKRDLPWDRIIITLSDERFVPNTSKDCNERALREYLVSKIHPEPAFISLVTIIDDSVGNLAAAAEELEKIRHYPNVIVIGMGIDSHITSLFGKEDLVHTGTVCTTVAPNGVKRISLTLAQLCKANRIFLLIAGKEKKQVLDDVLRHKNDTPISALIELAAAKLAVYSTD